MNTFIIYYNLFIAFCLIKLYSFCTYKYKLATGKYCRYVYVHSQTHATFIQHAYTAAGYKVYSHKEHTSKPLTGEEYSFFYLIIQDK